MSDPLRVFISYRRSDCLAQANALNDGLKNRLKDVKVFMDMDSIPPGVDFERHIRREIAQTHVVLVMIGDNWLDVGPAGVRRIDEPNDFVRLEVESALAEESTRLIPVLVEGASMPPASELPESIARLARYNAIELSDQRWTQDIQRMAETIDGIRNELLGRSAPQAPGSSAPSYSPPRPPTSQAPPAPTWSAPPPASAPPTTARPQSPPVASWTPSKPPGAPPAKSSQNKALIAAAPFVLTCCSCGLFAPVVTGWLASKHKHKPGAHKKLLVWTGVLTAALIVGLILIGVAPVDEEGTPTGPASSVGAGLYFFAMIAALVLIWVYRAAEGPVTGAEAGLQRRQAREQYRDLVRNDPALARSIHVGRPDLSRDYDDGGLVDLNSIPIQWLQANSGLGPAEVGAIASAREQMGGAFSSVDELLAFSSNTSNRLTHWAQEYAITL